MMTKDIPGKQAVFDVQSGQLRIRLPPLIRKQAIYTFGNLISVPKLQFECSPPFVGFILFWTFSGSCTNDTDNMDLGGRVASKTFIVKWALIISWFYFDKVLEK